MERVGMGRREEEPVMRKRQADMGGEGFFTHATLACCCPLTAGSGACGAGEVRQLWRALVPSSISLAFAVPPFRRGLPVMGNDLVKSLRYVVLAYSGAPVSTRDLSAWCTLGPVYFELPKWLLYSESASNFAARGSPLSKGRDLSGKALLPQDL